MEHIQELILQHLGAWVFICISLSVALICGAWWARGMKEKMKEIERLPCNTHADEINTHRHRQTMIENAVSKIETSIEYLQRNIDSFMQAQQRTRIITDFTQSHSPLAVSAAGLEMMARTGMQEMFDSNWERIRELISSNVKGVNPYDIQQFCLQNAVVYPEKFLLPEQIEALKIDAYNNGFALTSYMKVIAVLSRDRYFSEKSISISEFNPVK